MFTLVAVVVNYGWYVFYGLASALAIYLCYSLGNTIWNVVELIYDERENE